MKRNKNTFIFLNGRNKIKHKTPIEKNMLSELLNGAVGYVSRSWFQLKS